MTHFVATNRDRDENFTPNGDKTIVHSATSDKAASREKCARQFPRRSRGEGAAATAGTKTSMRLDEEQRKRGLALLEEGQSSRTVAGKIGCSIRTVQRLARELDATKPLARPAGEWRVGDNAPEQPREMPSYTRPPALGWDELDAPAPTSRANRATVTSKACAAVAGVVFLGASVALTGTLQLAATARERRDIGGALAVALQSFPKTSSVVKIFKAIGPWSGVVDGLATAIYRRASCITRHRTPKQGGRDDALAIGTTNMDGVLSPHPLIGGDDEVFAPDPGA